MKTLKTADRDAGDRLVNAVNGGTEILAEDLKTLKKLDRDAGGRFANA